MTDIASNKVSEEQLAQLVTAVQLLTERVELLLKDNEQYLTLPELAEQSGVSRYLIQKWYAQGRIKIPNPTPVGGRQPKYTKEDVLTVKNYKRILKNYRPC